MKNSLHIERAGTVGLLITVLLSPCCFPALGFTLGLASLGSTEAFGTATPYLVQGFAVAAFLGVAVAFRKNRLLPLLLAGLFSTALILVAYQLDTNEWLVYTGMAGLLGVSLYPVIQRKPTLQLQTQITCPHCYHKQAEQMPVNACQYFYECTQCKVLLKPKPGDCCVYCSYGTVPCPPIQTGENCC